MQEQLRREIMQIRCPEGRGEARLLVEWRSAGQGGELNGASCGNPMLKDLSGSDCHWTCWGAITELRKK